MAIYEAFDVKGAAPRRQFVGGELLGTVTHHALFFGQLRIKQQRINPGLISLAEEDGALVGHVLLGLADDGGWVHVLGVRKAARGRGIGRALLAYLARRAPRSSKPGLRRSLPRCWVPACWASPSTGSHSATPRRHASPAQPRRPQPPANKVSPQNN